MTRFHQTGLGTECVGAQGNIKVTGLCDSLCFWLAKFSIDIRPRNIGSHNLLPQRTGPLVSMGLRADTEAQVQVQTRVEWEGYLGCGRLTK
jgi:hypothetical protein